MPLEREIEIRRLHGDAEMARLYDLRAAMLRPGRPVAENHYPTDYLPTTIHLGAFYQGQCIGIASLYEEVGLHLRGMVVAPAWQGYGVGAALLHRVQQQATRIRMPLWCNARDSAMGFYAKLGWWVEGDGFELPGVGPHHRMRWVPAETNAAVEESSDALLCEGRRQRRRD